MSYPPAQEITGESYEKQVKAFNYDEAAFAKYLALAKKDRELQAIIKASPDLQEGGEEEAELVRLEIYADLYRHHNVRYMGIAYL